MNSFQKHKTLVECDSVFSSALLTRIPKLTLVLHNTKGGMIWGAYNLEEFFLASLFKAAASGLALQINM